MKENIKTACAKFILPVLITLSIYLILKYAFWTVFPFVFAFAVAYMIRKAVVLVIKVTGLKLKEASFVLLFICYAIFFISLYFLFEFIVKEGIKLAENLPQIYKNEIEPIISGFLESNTIQNSLIIFPLNELKNIASSFVVEISGKIADFALNIPDILITVTVTIIASFFLCLDYDNIKNSLLGLLPLKLRRKLIDIKQSFIFSLGKILRCYLIIFAITFIELFIGLILLRVQYPIAVAFLIAFADFLPLIGTGTVLIPWAVIAFLSRKSAFSLGIIALYLIITVIRNIVEPKILGKNIGIHPLLTLAAMYIGLKMGGFLLAFMLPICLLLFKTSKKQ